MQRRRFLGFGTGRLRGRLMFDITKEDLIDLLREIDSGKIQLPEFQRSYVWNDSDVRSLIASVAKGYPVGALLTLQSGGEVKFKPRLIEGVPPKSVEPSEPLLDGQQRMTSLYQVAFSKAPVRTRTDKKVEVERYYYLDMKKAANADIGEAIIAVSADRTIRGIFGKEELDLRTMEKEFEQDMFPLNQISILRGGIMGGVITATSAVETSTTWRKISTKRSSIRFSVTRCRSSDRQKQQSRGDLPSL
jgi:uncharacterized protein with ParB-like and HNH nuclease domain